MLHAGGAQQLLLPTSRAPQPDPSEGGAAPPLRRSLLGEAMERMRRSEVYVDMRRLLSEPKLRTARRLLLAKATLDLAPMIVHAVYSDYTSAKFGWDARANGMSMAYSGLLSIASDLVVMPQLYKRRVLTELPMVLWGAGAVGVGLLAMSASTSTRAFSLALALLAVGTALFKSAASAILLNSAAREQAGQMSGASDAAEAVCRVVAPLGGGLLLEHGLEWPARVAVLLCGWGAHAMLEAAPEDLRRKMMASRAVPATATDLPAGKKAA